MARYDDLGRQIADPRPVEVPVDFRRPLNIHDEIRRFIRQEISRKAQDNDLETFEESDDFDVEDEDELPLSGYEVQELVPEAGDVDATPVPDPKARPPGKLAEGQGVLPGVEMPVPPDDVQAKADSPSKS